MPYEYRTNICRTDGGIQGEAVITGGDGRVSDAAVAYRGADAGDAGVPGLRGSATAAGPLSELPDVRLGCVRLEGPVPAARSVGLTVDGFRAEMPANEAEVVAYQVAWGGRRVRVVTPDGASVVGTLEDCEDVEFALGYFVE